METIETYNAWAGALALTQGMQVVEARPARWVCFILDSTDGAAQ